MNIELAIRSARQQSGLTLRELAQRAKTSHSALAAYESGSKVPNVETMDRIINAAGFAIDIRLEKRVTQHSSSSGTKGDELAEVLRLAEHFPTRHSPHLKAPIFGKRS